jgi:hypothetical protein
MPLIVFYKILAMCILTTYVSISSHLKTNQTSSSYHEVEILLLIVKLKFGVY